ncbi:MAG TPA: type IV pilus assembly protein PilM [Patescibacteria group bacterium]|nr:type IV pilus assembly protein PilM [Patescibacteria group bacterium]
MSWFGKTEGYLGIDIGAHGIKLVELHKTKGRPQLWTYGLANEELDIHLPTTEKTAEQLLSEGSLVIDDPKKRNLLMGKADLPSLEDPRIDRYAQLLKDLMATAKVQSRQATASLPVSYVFHTVLTMPRLEDKDVERVVKAEVAKMLPRPLDEMQIVFQKLPSLTVPKAGEKAVEKYMRVLVTAAPRVLIQFYTAIFQRAGLQLQELETEAFALERSLVGRDQATVMVIDIGAERTNFFIIDQSLPLTHRSISTGGRMVDMILSRTLGLPEEEIGQVKKDLSRLPKLDASLFSSIVDPIVKEIEYSFDLFVKQSGNESKRTEKIILTGGSSTLPFIKEEISRHFPLRVFVGDPWARLVYQDGLRPVLDSLGPRMAVSIGLALRKF